MKDFTNFGVRVREISEYNYKAVWYNLKTVRVGKEEIKELPCDRSEFYDIAINDKCNSACDFCYVSAGSKGENYKNICNTLINWLQTFPEDYTDDKGFIITSKPFQVAIGSTGEPTLHPELSNFLKILYENKIVPNYTTNGIILSEKSDYTEKLLEATRNYVGGVAISVSNPLIRKQSESAIERLILEGNTHINLHHIITDNKKSVDDFLYLHSKYKDHILYHVLLPLMPAGRSKTKYSKSVFEYLEDCLDKYNIYNIAYGAHFYDELKDSHKKIWLYPPESMSKNIIMKENKVIITPSSFNLTPIKTIEL